MTISQLYIEILTKENEKAREDFFYKNYNKTMNQEGFTDYQAGKILISAHNKVGFDDFYKITKNIMERVEFLKYKK